jgi:hypothetical protein
MSWKKRNDENIEIAGKILDEIGIVGGLHSEAHFLNFNH